MYLVNWGKGTGYTRASSAASLFSLNLLAPTLERIKSSKTSSRRDVSPKEGHLIQPRAIRRGHLEESPSELSPQE